MASLVRGAPAILAACRCGPSPQRTQPLHRRKTPPTVTLRHEPARDEPRPVRAATRCAGERRTITLHKHEMRGHRAPAQRRAIFPCKAMSDRSHLSERDLSAAWKDGLFRGPFAMPNGRTVEIVPRRGSVGIDRPPLRIGTV